MKKIGKGSGGGTGVPGPEGASWESVAAPPGLTLEELQMLNASPMAGLARSTGVAYERMSGYFQQWCDDRGIELEQVETAHLTVYLLEARRRGAPKGPVSVRSLRTTLSAVKRVWEFHKLADRVDWHQLSTLISYEARMENSEPVGGARHEGRLHGGQSGYGGF